GPDVRPVRARLDMIAVRPIRADPEREITEEVVEVLSRARREGRLQALGELVDGQAAGGGVVAQRRRGLLALGVGCPHRIGREVESLCGHDSSGTVEMQRWQPYSPNVSLSSALAVASLLPGARLDRARGRGDPL